MDVLTPSGLARVTWHGAGSAEGRANGILLLGHGAGGGIAAPDLLLTGDLASEVGYTVGLVEQPYRVIGRRAPAPAGQLDAAFTAVAAAAREAVAGAGAAGVPLVVGGRSSGARVACRTAQAVGAAGVLALAFPLQPPKPPGKQRPTRLPELVGTDLPVLVVQGERDPFGSAGEVRAALADAATEASKQVTVSTAPAADHSLRKGIDTAEISSFLEGFLR